MNNRTFLTFSFLFLAVISLQLLILFNSAPQPATSYVLCRGLNAGLPLRSTDGRVLAYPAGRHREPAAQGQLNLHLAVPSGSYDLLVLYTRSHDQQQIWVPDVTVAEGEVAEREVQFSSGQLKISALSGRRETESGEAVVYVFAPDDHDRVITSMKPAEPVLLSASEYDVRVVLLEASEEKGVKWLNRVSVKAGLMTEHQVYFSRGTLWVRATNAGRELPAGAVGLTVYRSGDLQQEVLESGKNGLPVGLEDGVYDVKATFTHANDRPFRWIRDLRVQDGDSLTREVEFSSGTALVKASAGKELEGYQAYVYFYYPGDHRQPVAYTPAGRAVLLTAGRYDVRVHYYRSHDQPQIWRRDLQIIPGETVTESVTFSSGQVLVRAYQQDGRELIGDNVFLYVYAADEVTRPLVVARSGEEIVLTAGLYDIRAEDSRQAVPPSRWLRKIRLRAGDSIEKSVTFSR